MDGLQLFAVTGRGIQPLGIPDGVTGYDDLYDDLALGVYSALRTFSHNRFLCLDAHLARLKQSMTLLGWQYQLDEPVLCAALHQACTNYPYPDARVRIDVLAEPAQSLCSDSRELITLRPFEPIAPQVYENGVSLALAPGLSRDRPHAKTADFALKRRDYAATHPAPAVYEYLILDGDGYILEGTGSNFFGVRNGIVHTAASGVLEGITRKIILELIDELSIPLRLNPVHVDAIPELDEAGLSSSSRALLPVVQIGDQAVGDGRPGPICRRILAAYNEFVAENVEPAISP